MGFSAESVIKWRTITLLALAELMGMTLWFSASAVIPQLQLEWQLTTAEQSWMTMSVQIGFVAGALVSALLNLADRFSNVTLISVSAILGSLFNLYIPLFATIPTEAILFRFFTGFVLAGIYPPGMKLIASWCGRDRGLGIGILVGALTFGSAMPHLLNGLSMFGSEGMPPWRSILTATSSIAAAGALITFTFVKAGPLLTQSAPFNWRFAAHGLIDKSTRLANFGYLGHMWELYAMWSWAPIFIMASYAQAGYDNQLARLVGFSVIAVGALGSLLAGKLADQKGRTTITIVSLCISGACAACCGLFFDSPEWLTLVCLVWGFAIVADSAQFSTAITELCDPRYVGTALTVQTSLGFLLTLVTIHFVPILVEYSGWRWVFLVLIPGPLFGIISMWILRRMPAAKQMASGNR